MRQMKTILVALGAVAATTLLGAGGASATTLEVGGVTKNEAVAFKLSIKAGTSSITRDTFGFSVNTCTGSNAEGKTTTFTGASVSGPISLLTFTNCTQPLTVDKPGSLSFAHIAGTTNASVYSSGAEWTEFSQLHNTYINCKTTGQVIGTLTGTAKTTEHATLHINAVRNCEPHLSSAKWTGTYTVTTPTGLGISA